jgi:hypothetical protein
MTDILARAKPYTAPQQALTMLFLATWVQAAGVAATRLNNAVIE